MTEAELIKCLSERFYSDFADTVARRVRDAGAVGLLYEVVTSRCEGLPRAVGHKVAFRGAYVLEKIYFDAPDSFMPYAGLFCRTDFPACADPSARRHFAKVMADLLGRFTPEVRDLERIAEAAARWAVDPGAKVAVKIWAVEVLKHCRQRVGWVQEVWDDLVETMAPGRSSSPAASSVRAECCFLVCRRAVLRSRSPTRMMLSLPVQSRL